jgi:hypothetical protein
MQRRSGRTEMTMIVIANVQANQADWLIAPKKLS